MTIPTNNASSSSSATPPEMSDTSSDFDNLAPLELILSYIKEGMSFGANGERGIRNRGLGRYLIGNEDDDEDDDDDDSTSSPDETECTSIFNPIIVSDDSWNPRNVDWTFHENKHEPAYDSHMSPSRGNVYFPSSSDVSSDDDAISNALDVAFAKDISISKSSGVADAPDTVVNEEDVQERSNKAAFAQELFMSTLFSE